jgi:hypothetical protein
VRTRAQRQHRRRDRGIRTLEVDDEAAEADPRTPNAQKAIEKTADPTVSPEAHGAVVDEDAAVPMDSSNIAVKIRGPERGERVAHLGRAGYHLAPAMMGQAPPVIARPEMP